MPAWLHAPGLLSHGLWPRHAMDVLSTTSDIATGLAAIAVLAGLAALLARRQKLLFGWTFWLFALAGLARGITLLMDVLMPWHSNQGIPGLIETSTALASVVTAALLWIIPPRLQMLPASMRFRRARHRTAHECTVERLRQTEACLRFLAENVQDCAMFVTDRAGQIVSWNSGSEHVQQYAAAEIIGQNVACFYSEEDQAAGKPARALEIAARNGKLNEEGWRIRADGGRFVAEVAINPLRDTSGELTGFAHIIRDMTLPRQAEQDLQQARAALAQSQKMEAVGQLTGGIAHDFNNVLAAILGSLELLEVRQEAFSQSAARILRVIRHATSHGADLTHRLMAFSRKQALAPTLTSTNRLVGGMAELLRRTLGNSVTIETVLAQGLWPALVDPNQVERALLNLAVNARDAMRGGGKLTIETGNAFLDEDYARRHGDVAVGQYSFIAVSDTGSGMSPEVLERAFEPFYTTKDTGRGTGLGLSQVYDFVRQSGGHIDLHSEIGHGTTVKMYFPRPDAGQEAATMKPEVADGPLPRGNETILVVEDNADVRNYSTNAARQLGYSVLEAADATSAIVLLDANPDVRLLFTDVGLHGTNGQDLADRAKTVRPDLKIVFTSGCPQAANVDHGSAQSDELFLPKPFPVKSFAQILRSALDAA